MKDKIKSNNLTGVPENIRFGTLCRFIHSDDEELPTAKWLVINPVTDTPYVVEVVDNLGRIVRVSTLSTSFEVIRY